MRAGFYPRIRHESSLEDAAKIVLKHLRDRVNIAALSGLPHDVPNIWLKQITDEAGFEIIYVAALRAIGIPARLDSSSHAEFYAGNKWQTAPSPSYLNGETRSVRLAFEVIEFEPKMLCSASAAPVPNL
jgi:hypothetical protein